jgi:hypothetical protein
MGPNEFEVSPTETGQPMSLFTWLTTNESASVFVNTIGAESSHADQVGSCLYGSAAGECPGVAPGVSHVSSYEADYFVNNYIQYSLPVAGQVVNQSFVFDGDDEEEVDFMYDNYVAAYGTIFCSAVGNGGPVAPAGTAYNVIGVGDYALGGSSSYGPTQDGLGRSKPDLVAPAQATSFATPCVSGAAALLLQAVNEGYSGQNAAAAGDRRTVKALLMNGALKPYDWTHTATAPLDTRYGAGLLNVFYSYQQLAAGQQPFSAATLDLLNHAPVYSNPIPSLLGWDFQTTSLLSSVNHYCFNVSGKGGGPFTLTATLVWEIAAGAGGINNLYFYLYDTDNKSLVAQSVSSVDNIQHLYVPKLAPGHYDLEVCSPVLTAETYALAYQFFPIASPALALTGHPNNMNLSWPATPTLFTLQHTPSHNPPAWSAVTNFVLLTNQTMSVTGIAANGTGGFYRLVR